MNNKFAVCSMAVGLAAALSAPRALAVETLAFDDVVLFGGSISYTGDPGDPLIGTDIIFDTVTGIDTSPAGSLKIIGGSLDFATGPNLSEASLYTFAGGGSFVLSGTVIRPDLSIVASGVLLSGSFTGTSIVLGLGGGAGLFAGVGIDSKNADLLAEYGIDPLSSFEFANTEIGFSIGGVEPDGGFSASVIDADLVNRRVPVPDSGSTLALLGSSLLGFAGLTWRRKS